MSEAHREDLEPLQAALGYLFEQPHLLVLAVTHRSYVNEHEDAFANNQRLEFFGDSVLGMVVAEYLFQRFPNAEEGDLTSRLASLVNETALAEVATALALGDYLRLGRGEVMGGGRTKPSLLADAYEAVVAAVYLDGGLSEVRDLILRLHADALATCEAQSAPEDDKSKFQRLVQAEGAFRPNYAIIAEHGPAHERLFVATVSVEGVVYGQGEGRSKKAAEQSAAGVALTRWVNRG